MSVAAENESLFKVEESRQQKDFKKRDAKRKEFERLRRLCAAAEELKENEDKKSVIVNEEGDIILAVPSEENTAIIVTYSFMNSEDNCTTAARNAAIRLMALAREYPEDTFLMNEEGKKISVQSIVDDLDEPHYSDSTITKMVGLITASVRAAILAGDVDILKGEDNITSKFEDIMEVTSVQRMGPGFLISRRGVKNPVIFENILLQTDTNRNIIVYESFFSNCTTRCYRPDGSEEWPHLGRESILR